MKDTLFYKAAFKSLKLYQLMAFLHCTDSANSAQQKELKGKDAMILCVLNFLPRFAEGIAQPNGAGNCKAPPAQPSDDDYSDEVSLASESESDSEEKNMVDKILAARNKGRDCEWLVSREGFGDEDNTWEQWAKIYALT
ncbi:MAG: hypothetical protein SGPRY_011626, partial [Prymnesium sp.]